MRKILLPLIFSLTALFGLHAQSENDAIYIYRNDGQFNAFFDARVDSITCSHYDADSIWHSDWQMQVVYTSDSIYRIPLAVIDSVAFAAPAPVLSNDVVRMEKGLLDYLVKVEGMALTFESSLPKTLEPSKGDILVCTDFEHPLFEEGFVGKVYDTSASSDGFLVRCDTVSDITEVFDCVVGIEEVVYDDPGSTRGSWSSAPIPIEASLNYDTGGSGDLGVSMSGTVSGRVKATIVYNISRERQHISAMLNHDWNLGANIKLKSTMGRFFRSAPAQQLSPAVRFPAALPILKFQLFGAPFVRGSADAELEVSLSSPTHSYTSGIVYENGAFQGVHRSLGNSSGSINPTFSSTLSLNGYVQGGYLFDFYLGTIQCLGYVKSAVDFYIGPKLTGNYKMDLGAAASRDYYHTVKDSKVGLSLLSLDAEAYGEAAYMGESVARHTFMELSLASLLYNEWYLFPEFSDITVEPSKTDAEATLSYRPSRNVLLPLTLGIGLYDKDDEPVDDYYSESEYKRDDSGFEMEHTFSSLTRNKPYTAYPLIKYAGGTIVATPSKDFRLDALVETGEASSVTASSAVVAGYAEGLESAETLCELGVCYSTSGTPSINNGKFVSSGRTSSGEFTVSLTGLQPNTTYYYATLLAIDGEYFYGDMKYFKTEELELCPDHNHPHLIDLGLPSGTKWACCNVGASVPEDCGGYYAWGETEEKSNYHLNYYKYWFDYDADGYGTDDEFLFIGNDISSSNYDAAKNKWGSHWKMPTLVQIEELIKYCKVEWYSVNGRKGLLFCGNGKYLFIPAVGYKYTDGAIDFNSGGAYWTANSYPEDSKAYQLSFGSNGVGLASGWGWRANGQPIRSIFE